MECGSQLTILDDAGNYTYLNGITPPFQLFGDKVVYEKYGNLMMRDIATGKNERIARNVDIFIAYDQSIYYLTYYTWNQQEQSGSNALFAYDLMSGETRTMHKNISTFYIKNEKVYAFSFDGSFGIEDLMEMPLEGGEAKKLHEFHASSLPYHVKACQEYIVYKEDNGIVFENIHTGKKQSVTVAKREYIRNRIDFICDDKFVYVSYQTTKANGSIVSAIEDEANGLYKIDPQTLAIEKLSSETYDFLYLFDGDQLFANKGNKLFKLDCETGQATELTGSSGT